MLTAGVGLVVFGGVRFYTQEQVPFLSPPRECHAVLTGELRVSPIDYSPDGPTVWALLVIIGAITAAAGLVYDPAARARSIMVREESAIHHAQDAQVDHLLNGRDARALSFPDSRVLGDMLDYFNNVQWRVTDVVLGAPPPTYPAFQQPRRSESASVAESDD